MARLNPLHIVPAVFAAASHAGDMSFPATISGSDARVVLETPDLPVLETAVSGSRVSQGDLLVKFDGAPLEALLAETRRIIADQAAAISRSKVEFETLRETASRRLDSVRRAAENAKEAHTLFIRTRRKAAEQAAVKSLRVAEEILASQRQELARLAKWQDAGDSAGGLSETMLENHEDDMAAAEFSMRMEMFNHRRVVDVMLPREARTLAETANETAAGLLKAESEIPVMIELKRLAAEALKTGLGESQRQLADLETTRSLLEYRAPADGWFHQDDGIFSFVPATAEFDLVAVLDEAAARKLSPGLAVKVIPAGRPDLEIPAKIASLTPEAEGRFRAVIAAAWTDGFFPEPGGLAQVRIPANEPPLS